MESADIFIEPAAPWITRHAGPKEFTGWYFQAFDTLFEQLPVDGSEACLFADLSLGAWQGHWIGRSLCRQLDLDFGEPVQPVIGGNKAEEDYADTVSMLIDNESAGDVNRMKAFRLAEAILPAMRAQGKRQLVVLLPVDDTPPEPEDAALLELLLEGSDGILYPPVLVAVNSYTALPAGWHIDWQNEPLALQPPAALPAALSIPGLLSLHDGIALAGAGPGAILKCDHGLVLLSPVLRLRQPFPLPEGAPDWLAAYHTTLEPVPDGKGLPFLQQQAGIRFAEGGYNIALRLLDSALSLTQDITARAGIIAQQQNIRIALMRFKEAAAAPLPEQDIPDHFRASLLQSKAWGLVMTNRPEEAEPLFEEARTILSPERESRLYQYLLNISALNKLRLGDDEAALALEKRIEQQLDSQAYKDWHICYINSINQARLFKKRGALDLSEAYYHRAFDITWNLRNESDLFYTNFCLAQLETLKGNPDAAFIRYFRSAIHWLSNPMPETLAPRVVSAVTGFTLPPQELLVEEVSGLLLHQLQAAAVQAGLEAHFPGPRSTDKPAPVFTRPDAVPWLQPDFAAGIPGWGVLVSSMVLPPKYTGPRYDQLAATVYALMQVLVPAASFPEGGTVLADDCFGTDLPGQAAAMLSLVSRYKLTKVCWGGSARAFSPETLQELEQRAIVQLSPAIRFINNTQAGMKVHFRRYLPPVSLLATEAALLRLVDGRKRVEALTGSVPGATDIDVLAMLRLLERARVIQLVYE